MPQSYEFCKSVIDTISARPGLYSLVGRPGTGKTTGVMLFIHLLAEEGKKCLVLSLEMTGASWLGRMKDLGLNTDRVIINVSAHCTVENLGAMIKAEKPDMVFIDYIQLFEYDTSHSNKISELKDLAAEVPLLFTSQIGRDPGFAGLLKSENVVFDFSSLGVEMAIVSIGT